MEKISQHIREEIKLKTDKVYNNPEYYDKRKALVCEDLRSIGDVYSFWIENPDLRKALLTDKKKEETIKKEARKGIHAVHNGWYFLSQKGKYGSFVDELSATLLERLNGLIVPNFDISGEFRKEDVTLSILGYTPPSWERVPEKVNDAISKVRDLYKEDPLEAAIYAHLSISAIQPFPAGNKRSARLVQDRILYDAGLPPALITAGEGKFYFDLLSKTLVVYEEDNIEGQRQFYDYCASKVNNGLDEILGDLKECNNLDKTH